MRSPESKKKTGDTMRGKPRGHYAGKRYCDVKVVNCYACDAIFYCSTSSKRKTCSTYCRTLLKTSRHGHYQNGSKKSTLVTNPWTGEDVWLDSSWEVTFVEALNRANIEWRRPKPLRWTDPSGKERLYYPDFWLPNLTVYVDPKNPYCCAKDVAKMKAVSRDYYVIYGDIKVVMLKVGNLVGKKL